MRENADEMKKNDDLVKLENTNINHSVAKLETDYYDMDTHSQVDFDEVKNQKVNAIIKQQYD